MRRRGWKVAGVFTDNDVSASSRKPRPEWQRVLADVEAGRVDAIVGWHVDRITRSPAELEGLISFVEQQGLELATVTGDVDLSTPTGRLVSRTLGAAARHEIEHKSERQRRGGRQRAENGKPHAGGTRPYGFEADRVTIIPAEAKVIVECSGASPANRCPRPVADLHARGIETPTGRAWQPRTLRRLLASADQWPTRVPADGLAQRHASAVG